MIINIRKSDNLVVDTEQFYDERFFDNTVFPDGTIPQGDNPQKYQRSGGLIQRRSPLEVAAFRDEKIADLLARIDGSALPSGVKQILRDLISLRDN